MTAINQNLLLSLKQDLNNLNSTQNKILPHIEGFELNSWLYPTKKYYEVNSTSIESALESDQYSGLLELIVDKLYLVTHLIIKYVTDLTTDPEQLPRNVKYVRLSLGASVDLLWTKLKRSEKVSNTKPKTVLRFDSFTQTIHETNPSRVILTPIFKELLTALQPYDDFRNFKTVQEQLRRDVYNSTNHSCINRLTAGLVDDIKDLLEHRILLENQRNMFRKKLKKCNFKYQQSLKTIGTLNRSFQKFRRLYNNELVRRKKIAMQLSVTEETKIITDERIKKYTITIKDLEKLLEEAEVEQKNISSSRELLANSITRLNIENAQLREDNELWKARFSDVLLENTELVSRVRLLQETQRIKSIDEDSKQHMKKLEAFNIEMEKKTRNFKNIIQTIMDVADSQLIKEAGQVRQQVSSFIGDPIADMRQQIKINQATIEELENRNSKLSETINRIRTTKF